MRKLPALSAMKVFEVVGQTRSFTRAAEILNLTQSAVSKQVRNLEKQLGENLLIRHHHDLELTRAGSELLTSLQQAFHNVELTVRSIMEKSNRNRLRLNVPPTFARRWLMPRLPGLLAALPDIEISLSTHLSDSLAERSLLDCAIRFGDGEWPMLQSRVLMTERHIAVCAPSLRNRAEATGRIELSSFRFLHVLAAADQRYLTWQHWLSAAGLGDTDVGGGLEFDLLDLVIEAACSGLGIAVVDRHMVSRELESGKLVPLLDVEVEGHESYWLVTRTDQPEPPHMQAFRAWLLNEVAAGQEQRPGRTMTPAQD